MTNQIQTTWYHPKQAMKCNRGLGSLGAVGIERRLPCPHLPGQQASSTQQQTMALIGQAVYPAGCEPGLCFACDMWIYHK
jgi:hypothetical protein